MEQTARSMTFYFSSMNAESTTKKETSTLKTRIEFVVSALLLLASLEYHPHNEDVLTPNSIIVDRNDQTIIDLGDYHGSASAILSKRGDLNLLNIHLGNSYGGMLNAEFSGALPEDGETCVYFLDEAHYVWFIDKDISDKRIRGVFSLRNENGRYYGEVLDDIGKSLTFVLRQ